MGKVVKIRDAANLTLTINGVTIQACDVDADGNVENVDIIVNHRIMICENIQTNEPFGFLVQELWRAHGLID